jgi:hypothetical protein
MDSTLYTMGGNQSDIFHTVGYFLETSFLTL